MTARTLMFQSAGSDASKSTLVAALCRALEHRGACFAPFTPALLRRSGLAAPIPIDHEQRRERSIDRPADEIERSSLAILPSIEPTGIELRP